MKYTIELVADTKGLQPAIDGLESVKGVSKEVEDSFKNGGTNVGKFGAALDKLLSAYKNTSQAAVGLWGSKLVDEAGQKIKLFGDKLVVNKKLLDEQLAAQKKFNDEAGKQPDPKPVIPPDTPQKVESFRTQLRQSRDELVKMMIAGELSTAEIYKMAKGAGELKDQVGDAQQAISVLASDTFKLDAALQGIQVGAAGFQVMQGAAALFGSENKELEKTLVKLNAVMAVTNGLKQIQDGLQKQTALSQGLNIAAQKAYNFVIGESVGALKAFRIALAATGIGLAVIAIAALVTNWDKLKVAIFGASESAADYAKKQEKIQETNEKTNKQLEKEIEYLKNIGKLTEESGQIKYNEKLAQDRAAAGKEYLKQVEALKAVQKAEKETFQVQSIKYERMDTYHKATQKQVDEQIKKVKEAYNAYITSYNIEAQGQKDLQKIREKKVKVLKEEKRAKEEILALENIASAIEVGSEEWYKRQIEQWEDIASKLKMGSTAYRAVREEIDNLNAALDRLKNPLADLEKKPQGKTVAEEIKERVDKEEEVRKAIAEGTIESAKEVSDAIFQITSNQRNAEFNAQIERLNQLKDKELANKNLTDEQKARIEERYQRQIAAIKTKQAQADKQAAIAQAIINGALAITKILATFGSSLNPGAIASLAVTAASTAAQVAVIAAQKIPKFAKGTEFVSGAGSETSDSIPAMLSKGERVVPAHINKLLNGIPNEMLPEMLMPSKTMISANMDYDKMAKAFSKELASNPQLMVNFDRRGFETFIKNGNTTQQVKNSRNDF